MFIKDTETQLTYCSNIHPSSSWETCLSNIVNYGSKLKEKLSKNKPFGIGLRLSYSETQTLLQGENLKIFQEKLKEKDLYVFTMNGFPYGNFHHKSVKEYVHYPDWQSEKRVNYTLNLITILSQLLNDEEGSISTSPLTYKKWIKQENKNFWNIVTENLIEIVRYCGNLRHNTGKWIHIDIEPEPDGMLEKTDEMISFFRNFLLRKGKEILSKKMNIKKDEAEEWIRNHIQVCYDICHASVMYEDHEKSIQLYKKEGIGIGKMQISTALKVVFNNDKALNSKKLQLLEPFAESVYLHQVCQYKNYSFVQYPDLSYALEKINIQESKEWRIHFHIPIFIEKYQLFSSTQEDLIKALQLFNNYSFTRHLEIETYTWEVLPNTLKINLLDSIYREYEWVLKQLKN